MMASGTSYNYLRPKRAAERRRTRKQVLKRDEKGGKKNPPDQI